MVWQYRDRLDIIFDGYDNTNTRYAQDVIVASSLYKNDDGVVEVVLLGYYSFIGLLPTSMDIVQ